MTKEEIESRIAVLWESFKENEEENRFIEDEMDELDKLLESMEND